MTREQIERSSESLERVRLTNPIMIRGPHVSPQTQLSKTEKATKATKHSNNTAASALVDLNGTALKSSERPTPRIIPEGNVPQMP